MRRFCILSAQAVAKFLMNYQKEIGALLRMNEDELRERIIAISPDIKRDIERMNDLLREIVKEERAKGGYDKYIGKLTLKKNTDKKTPEQPILKGSGMVAGRFYEAAAWFENGILRIALEQPIQTFCTRYESTHQHVDKPT
jgi:hypothetical protein